MQCKGCERPIEGDAYRMVADWTFCVPCFEQLRKGAEAKRSERATADRVASSAPSAPVPAQRLCGTCEQPLVLGDEGLALGDIVLCAACRKKLIIDPMRAVQRREQAEAEAARAAEAEVAPPREREEVVPVGVPGRKRCASCARRLIEPGGYRWVGEHPYCPACAVEAEAEVDRRGASGHGAREPARPASSARAPAQGGEVLAEERCEACGRRLGSASDVATTRGFFLCQPCVEVDLESALSVARARHRRRLLALRRESDATSPGESARAVPSAARGPVPGEAAEQEQ